MRRNLQGIRIADRTASINATDTYDRFLDVIVVYPLGLTDLVDKRLVVAVRHSTDAQNALDGFAFDTFGAARAVGVWKAQQDRWQGFQVNRRVDV